MPATSEAQRRAMFAAAAGKSTLGIPKSVGMKFAAHDAGGKLPVRKALLPCRRRSDVAVTREEYARLLARPMAGKSRDERVRAANIAAGYGSSTAQRFMGGTGGTNYNLPKTSRTKAKSGGGGGGGGGAKKADPVKTSAVTSALPDTAPLPMPREFGSPDLAVSPPHEGWAGRTAPGPEVGVGVPMNPALSQASKLQTVPPDLAGSQPVQPLATLGGQVGRAAAAASRVPSPGAVGMPTGLDQGLDAYGQHLTVTDLLRRMYGLGGVGG